MIHYDGVFGSREIRSPLGDVFRPYQYKVGPTHIVPPPLYRRRRVGIWKRPPFPFFVFPCF